MSFSDNDNRKRVFLLTIAAMASATQAFAANEVVLYARNSTSIHGNWRVTSDSSAAGGASLLNPDQGAAKLPAALASPANYFDMSFYAAAGTPYRLWLRMKATNNATSNDSVYAQFSGSVDANGNAIYRHDTPDAATVALEDCNSAGVSGWGWNDNGWCGLGPLVYFTTSGNHMIRIQQREDGVAIDQIVMSPAKYLNAAPGALKSDATLLPASDGSGSSTGGSTGYPKIGHVSILVLENHSRSTIMGNNLMPYINGLATKYSEAKGFWANVHPSQPNYFLFTTGNVFSQTAPLPTGTPNVVKTLLGAGKKWKAYFEDHTTSAFVFKYLPEVVNSTTQQANMRYVDPDFQNDWSNGTLPQYSMIHPNIYNSAHNCVPNDDKYCYNAVPNCSAGSDPANPTCSGLKAADNWVKNHVDAYIKSPGFTSNNDLLVIMFDEGDGMLAGCGSSKSPIPVSNSLMAAGVSTCGDNPPLILVGPSVKRGYSSTTVYHDESILRMALEAIGVTSNIPAYAASAPKMTEFFQ